MSADLVESETDFLVTVDMPGVENFEINTDNQVLTISAERKIQHERDSYITHTSERSYGKVRRRLQLPFNADADRAVASYRNGVLSVSIPKREPSQQAKRINIE
jgi:HSP20 family protein